MNSFNITKLKHILILLLIVNHQVYCSLYVAKTLPFIKKTNLKRFSKNDNINDDQSQSFLEVQNKIKQIQISSADNIKTTLVGEFYSIQWDSAMASSTVNWWTRAENAIGGWWNYWLSYSKENQVIMWQGMFRENSRLASIEIHFFSKPQFYQIQSTQDGQTWEEVTPWRETINQQVILGRSQIYREDFYPKTINSKGIRIMFKDVKQNQFGIIGLHQVKVYTVRQNVYIRNGDNLCLVAPNSIENQKRYHEYRVYFKDCTQAISSGDNREIWTLQEDNRICAFNNQGLCLFLNDIEEKAVMTLSPPRSEHNRFRWNLMYNRIHPRHYCEKVNQNSCLVKSKVMRVIPTDRFQIKTQSTYDDNQHNPYNMLINDRNKVWQSRLGDDKNYVAILFPEITLRLIKIYWKFPPKKLIIQLLQSDNFSNQRQETWYLQKEISNVAGITEYDLANQEYTGIKLILIGAQQQLHKRDVFGIDQIEFINESHDLILIQDCFNQQLEGRDVFDFIPIQDQIDQSTKNEYNNQQYIFLNKIIQVDSVIKTYREVAAQTKNMILTGKKIRETIDQINIKITKIVQEINTIKITEFQKEVLEEQQQINTIGSSPNKPGLSCAAIKKMFSYKISGYYWIKPACSKVPLRMFCDFQGEGLSYGYIGGIKKDTIMPNEINTVEDIRLECAKIGLYPVEISSKQQIQQIQEYLDDLGVNYKGEAVIPLGYDYGCEAKKCKDKYQNLNNDFGQDRSELFNMLKRKGDLFQEAMKLLLDKSHYDSIGFGEGDQGLVTFDLRAKKIKGLVCSDNFSIKQFEQQFKFLKCDTTGTSDDHFSGTLGTFIRFVCPADCQKTKFPVYGSKLYKEDSSICKAAIHSGTITNAGGIAIYGVEGGAESYPGSMSNGIKTKNFDKKWETSFVITPYNPLCPMDFFQKKPSFLQIQSLLENQSESQAEIQTESQIANQAESQTENQIANQAEIQTESQIANQAEIQTENQIANQSENQTENQTENQINSSQNQYQDEQNDQSYFNYQQNQSEDKLDNPSFMESNSESYIQGYGGPKGKGQPKPPGKPPQQKSGGSKPSGGISMGSVGSQVGKAANKLASAFQGGNQLAQAANQGINKVASAGQNLLNTGVSAGQDLLNAGQDLLNAGASAGSNLLDAGQNLMNDVKEAIQNFGDDIKDKANNLISGITKDAQQIEQKTGGDSDLKNEDINTKSQTKIIEKISKIEENHIQNAMIKYKQFKVELESNTDIIQLQQTDISPYRENADIQKQENNILSAFQLIEKILQMSIAKNKAIKEKLVKVNIQKQMLLYRAPYLEEYTEEFNFFWEVVQNREASTPGIWKFSDENIQGHSKSISQVSDSKIESYHPSYNYPTMTVLKYREYYDQQIGVSMLIQEQGRVGIIFRVIDSSNYYIFEILSSEKGGKKRIQKYKNGIFDVLAEVEDGGMLEDKWYRVVITTEMNKIKIQFGEEGSVLESYKDLDKSLPVVLTTHDGTFSSGKIGFATDGIPGAFFDKIEITPLNCKNLLDDNEQNTQSNSQSKAGGPVYLPPHCNRFQENFKTEITEQWTSHEPEDILNGPSKWIVQKGFFDKTKAIVQTTKAYGKTYPNSLILNHKKNCFQGVVNAQFLLPEVTQDGFIGIGFFVQNSKKYHSVRFQQGGCHLFFNDKVLQSNNNDICKLKKEQWYEVQIFLFEKQVRVDLKGEDDSDFQTVLILQILNMAHHGQISLLANNQKVGFTNIRMYPSANTSKKETEQKNNMNQNGKKDNNKNRQKNFKDSKKNNQGNDNKEVTNTCNNKDQDTILKYCQQKYDGNKQQVKICQNKFCDICCDDTISSFKKQMKFTCVRECSKTIVKTKTQQTGPSHVCVEKSKRNTVGVYKACDTRQRSPSQCRLDFCDMCCVTFQTETQKTDATDQNVQNCYNACSYHFKAKYH